MPVGVDSSGQCVPGEVPKLFGGNVVEYLKATGSEIPLIVSSCVRAIDKEGELHRESECCGVKEVMNLTGMQGLAWFLIGYHLLALSVHTHFMVFHGCSLVLQCGICKYVAICSLSRPYYGGSVPGPWTCSLH